MEGNLLRKIPPLGNSQERLHSGTVGSHLKDKVDESEHLKIPKTDGRERKSRLKTGRINYIATHNINSLLQPGKLKVLTDEMDRRGILITGLQEMRNTDQEPMESQGYRIYKGIPGKRVMKNCPQFGTGFVISLKIIDSIIEFQTQSPRLSTLTIKVANKVYTIINAHAPTNDKNNRREHREEVDRFWEQLDQTATNINKNYIKILIGDFNAQLGKEKRYRDIIGKWPAQRRTNRNGIRLVEFCRNHDMLSKSTYFKRRPSKLKTWKHPDWKKGEWQLDHVCMDKNYHREIYNVKVLRGTDTGSDHYLINIKIKFTPFTKKKAHLKTKRTYDPYKLIHNKEYKEQTRNIKLSDDVEEITSQLKQIAEQIAPINPRKKHQWWNNDCDKAVIDRHQAWLRYQTKKTEESHLELTQQRKITQTIIRRVKRQYQKDILRMIETNVEKTNSREYYKIFGKQLQRFDPPTLMLKDRNNEMAHSNIKNTEILAETFNKLLNCEEPLELFQIYTDTPVKTSAENINPPTIQEVYKALKELKNYKASGEDQTCAELWKYAAKPVKISLHQCMVKIWNKEELPGHWTTAIIYPVHKRGDKSNPDNYRGISLLDCTYKVLSRILYNRCKDQLELELGEYQGGFRPWRSCPEQIITLKLVMDYYKRRQKQQVITFVDFKKAYDSIHRPSMMKILRNFGLHPKLIKMIELTLTNTTSKVKFRGELSEPFPIKTGLRQGDGLSPLLFNCALEYVMREWYKENPKNIRIGTKKESINLNCLGFADDLALLANNIQEAKNQIISLQNIAKKIGLQISFEKTEIMVTNPLVLNYIMINNRKMKIVKQFKYLGEVITYNLDEKRAWQERTNKMIKAQKLTWGTYNKKCLSIKTKLKHYKTVVQPEVTYASETLFKVTQKNRIDKILKVERRIVRTCINKKYQKDGQWWIVPNEVVYRELEPITDTIRKKRISFLGHVMRTPETRLLRLLIEKLWNLKQHAGWIKEIREDMEELEITLDDLRNKTQNLKKLKNSNIRFKQKIDKRHIMKRVFTDEERQMRSERMRSYWAIRKENTLKMKMTRK